MSLDKFSSKFLYRPFPAHWSSRHRTLRFKRVKYQFSKHIVITNDKWIDNFLSMFKAES